MRVFIGESAYADLERIHHWIEVDNAAENVVAFRRIAPSTGKEIICVCNFSPVIRQEHRLGLPRAGKYKQLLNTDHEKYCGGGFGVVKSITAEEVPAHGLDYSAAITLPPLATVWFEATHASKPAGIRRKGKKRSNAGIEPP